ncbi:MAG: hypothetical protein EOP52_04010 [Sphingobacteriales bacterium]|nr:MAG: hypothetical protein EOP52_04010 [Sphingobacteriales bacterium]
MKYKLFPVVLSCALTLSLLAQADTVTSKVSFGRASKNCSGLSVCETSTGNKSISSKESLTVSFTWDATTMHLTMRLPAASLSETPEDVLAKLRSGTFVVEEAFALSKEIISGLKGPDELRVAVGTYPAQKQSDGSMVIDFGAY